MSEASKPRAERKQRSPVDYPRYNYSLLSSTEAVFIMAQQTRDVALDTRDSMHRIEDILEAVAQEVGGAKLADALIAGLGPTLARAIAEAKG